jgi:hypothetical protein
VVFIVKEMRIRKVTNQLMRSDGFVAVIIIGLILSLSYQGSVCAVGQTVLFLSLVIPAVNYSAFIQQQRKWKHEVETSLVTNSTPARDDVSKLSTNLFNITEPDGRISPFVQKGRNFESVNIKTMLHSGPVSKELFGIDSDDLVRDSFIDEFDGENPLNSRKSSDGSAASDSPGGAGASE